MVGVDHQELKNHRELKKKKEENNPTYNPAKYRVNLPGDIGPQQTCDLYKLDIQEVIQYSQKVLAKMGTFVPDEDIVDYLPNKTSHGGLAQRQQRANTSKEEFKKLVGKLLILLYRVGENWPVAFNAIYESEAYKIAQDSDAIEEAMGRQKKLQERQEKIKLNAEKIYNKFDKRKNAVHRKLSNDIWGR